MSKEKVASLTTRSMVTILDHLAEYLIVISIPNFMTGPLGVEHMAQTDFLTFGIMKGVETLRAIMYAQKRAHIVLMIFIST